MSYMAIAETIKQEHPQGTKRMRVYCPVCKKSGMINVSLKVIQNSNHLATISVSSGVTCEHSYLAFVDKHGAVRGYQKADYEITAESQRKQQPPTREDREKPKKFNLDLEKIYNEFREFIDEDHLEFQAFIAADSKRS